MTSKKVPQSALHFTAAVELSSGDGASGDSGDRTFEGIAYSGGEITGHYYWDKVIFDLASTRADKDIIPVLFNHDSNLVVGRTSLEIGGQIVCRNGVIYNDQQGQQLILGKSGHPWQMSVYIRPGSIEEVASGSVVTVNGHQFHGPGHIFRNNVVKEASICAIGADSNTSAQVFSSGEGDVEVQFSERLSMTEQEIQAMRDQLTAVQAENATLRQAEIDRARAERFSAVKGLFKDLGRDEPTEAAVGHYLSMSTEQFSAVAADMRAAKPSVPAHLFSEQATNGIQAVESSLIADAKRRAAAAK